MDVIIKKYTKDRIDDVIDFEHQLRKEESFWSWEIDDAYIESVKRSFDDNRFDSSISLLAYCDNRVVGRIDSSVIASHFDGSIKAYLDWICVVKPFRHKGVAQALLLELRQQLKEKGVDTLIALSASNEEAQSFYKGISNSEMRDIGIWIDV
jgi:Acetyltransferases